MSTHDPLDPAQVKPLDADGVTAATVGTAGFAIATIVLLLMRTQLAAHDATWWIWVGVVGVLLGVAGTLFARRRRAVYRAAGATSH